MLAAATEAVKLTLAVPSPVTPLRPVSAPSVSSPFVTVRVVVSVSSLGSETEIAGSVPKASVPSSATVAVGEATTSGASLVSVTSMATVASSVTTPSSVVIVSVSDPT